ncbi:hypothetical protein TREMEDRAFT_58586 [Tremella mesenterica DSM 1558]|uniref:uncharacterized protein n=1 Tax=Tremella mesenterica (strain ATCC 24925 / CBS 8224 / DSM 1558 / NBRC 9311 / NRRL Y-6157 / RJB 2259-6 / UBC 559-6) TaxID=578456 RepID=UPI0003F4A566|nr:uncharacterized protein TREMEDRAFT_58586 [Tremella mesenterica DSM 1558]EIW72423.1 hypothetical protein TREMEDRAFT_58586 [Tremella mesenterica DSM 1558]
MTSSPSLEPTSPSSPSQTPKKSSKPSRRKQAENWDDDFEFALPSRTSKPREAPPRPEKLVEKDENTSATLGSFASGSSNSSELPWDESPPPPVSTNKGTVRAIKVPAPLKIPPSHSHSYSHSPPRMSPSFSIGLTSSNPRSIPPTPLSSSSHPHQPLLSQQSYPQLAHIGHAPRQRSGSQSAAIKNKLVKRHPSTSFVPMTNSGHGDWSRDVKGAPAMPILNRSSPNLASPMQVESYQLPLPPIPRQPSRELMPPPPPPGKTRSRSRSKSKPALRDEARPAQIQTSLRSPVSEQTKRDELPLPTEPKRKNFWKRLSGSRDAMPTLGSLGGSPIHRRRRSSSVGDSVPPLPSPRPPVPPLPANIRSPSNTSTASTTSASSSNRSGPSGLSSILRRSASNLSRKSTRSSDAPPTSYPFSNTRPDRSSSDSDTETEQDGKTPRRRQKIRPVSALPAPRMLAGREPWNGEDWQGFAGGPSVTNSSPLPPISSHHEPSPSLSGLPQSSGLASSAANTMKRLSSMSKKHARRLSSGLNFGTASSSSSTESKRVSTKLEPVLGSPSKPTRSATTSTAPNLGIKSNISNGSISAPSSSFKQSEMPTSISDEIIRQKAEKQKRRQSWNDFIIPKTVLEKQKGLKRDIGAVKYFAQGLETLKTYLETHAALRDKVAISGAPDELALFRSLESEFNQWWEMAVVLIEVGSTGRDNQTSSPRSRRITMSADEAHSASAMLHRLPSTSTFTTTPRKPNFKDSSESNHILGPPQASPDNWRASTGRQDLTKRQLEVLRTMLGTPVTRSPNPNSNPITSRQASTVSASSVVSNLPPPPLPLPPLPVIHSKPSNRSSEVRFHHDRTELSRFPLPSPDESSYAQSFSSFPSPDTASSMVNPKTRASKSGLAGLRDFLKSLKHQRPKAPVQPSINPNSNPIPTSPTSPISPALPSASTHDTFSPLPPSTRSSFSVLGMAPVPQRGGRRPNIRNIFRTSSGNWSDLVRERVSGESRRSKEEDRTSLPFSSPSIQEDSSQMEVGSKPVLGRRHSSRSDKSEGSGGGWGRGSTSPTAAVFGFLKHGKEREMRWTSNSTFGFSGQSKRSSTPAPEEIPPDQMIHSDIHSSHHTTEGDVRSDTIQEKKVTLEKVSQDDVMGGETVRPRRRDIGLGFPSSPDKSWKKFEIAGQQVSSSSNTTNRSDPQAFNVNKSDQSGTVNHDNGGLEKGKTKLIDTDGARIDKQSDAEGKMWEKENKGKSG